MIPLLTKFNKFGIMSDNKKEKYMTRENLLLRMEQVFTPGTISNLTKAAESIKILYGRIEDWAEECNSVPTIRLDGANQAAGHIRTGYELIYKIYCVLNIPPLSSFINTLSEDEHFAIRVAASGLLLLKNKNPLPQRICEAGNVMINAGFFLRGAYEPLYNEVASDKQIAEGLRYWNLGCPNITTVPPDY